MEAPPARRSFLRQAPPTPARQDDTAAGAPARPTDGAEASVPSGMAAVLNTRVQRVEELLNEVRTRLDNVPVNDPHSIAEEVRGSVPAMVDERVKPVADRIHELDDRVRRVESRLERLHEETSNAMMALETRFAAIRQEVTVMLGGVVIGAVVLLMLLLIRR